MFLILICLLIPMPASAAYRVYRLKVTPYDNRGRAKKPRYVLTTLDHIQYESVYGHYRRDRVDLVDTWYCPGDTARRALCKKPAEKDIPRGLAAYDHETRRGLPYNRQPVIP